MGAKQHSVLFVLFDLPTIGRVNFLDIDNIKVDLVRILAVNLVEGPSLGPKGGSGIAAENQAHRTFAKMVREGHGQILIFALS